MCRSNGGKQQVLWGEPPAVPALLECGDEKNFERVPANMWSQYKIREMEIRDRYFGMLD